MNDPPRVLLFGAGSIGSVCLYQFQRAGCRVTAVCRSNYDAVKRDGFSLKSLRFGDVQFRPDLVVRSAEECAGDTSYDFVFVTTKCFPGSKPSLSELIRPFVQGRPHTAIVLAQNGIAIEDEVAEAFPENPLLSCVVYLPAYQTEQGVIEYPEMLNLLEIGTFPANSPESHKAAATKLAGLVVAGGGQAEVHDDIQIARWSKILMNCSWNPICALALCTDGDFLNSAAPYAWELGWGVMKEIVELARTIGIPNVDEQVAEQKAMIAKRRAATNTGRENSMVQDVKQGKLFEVEAIVGNTVRLGRRHNVKMPRTEMLYALAKARFDALVREKYTKVVERER
jgi:2-dehydropantoate 2-reductase